MVLIPSLSLWSSIKIPLPLYGKKKTTPPVRCLDSCKYSIQRNYNKEAEPAREMVNLRVPIPLDKKEENFHSSPHSFGAISTSHKKKAHGRRTSKPKTKQISCVTIPNGAAVSWEEAFADNYAETVLNFQGSTATRSCEDSNDKYPEFNFEGVGSMRRECDWIPSVKPWTQEELEEISGKYNFLKTKTPKMTKDKKKKNERRENILTYYKNVKRPSGSLNEKKFDTFLVPLNEDFCFKNPYFKEYDCDTNDSKSDLNADHECLKSVFLEEGLTARARKESAGANYYENKLAKLYKLELDLKF